MRRRQPSVPHAAGVAVLFWAGLVSGASGHHQVAGSQAGVSVPSLTHGQMAVLAPHRAAILALADALPQPDATTRRLRNFAALEHSLCLWDLMPGSIADEASPFNACAHAEFAALRALLMHMAEAPGPPSATLALQTRIARDMGAHGESLTLCRYSDEPFNTAAPVGPDWTALPSHDLTILVLTAGVAILIAAGLLGWGLRQPPVAA